MAEFFSLTVADCQAHFFGDADIDRGHLCPSCFSRLVSFDVLVPRDIGLKRRSKDWAYTYDNQLLVSSNAREVLSEMGVPAHFIKANCDPSLWAVQFDNEFAFDTVARGSRFLDRCEVCGNFGSIVGAAPAYLSGAVKLTDSIYRSDVEFGSEQPKGSVIIVGSGTRRTLEARFPELDFAPAVNSDSW